MNLNKLLEIANPKPRCSGAGLITLDIVISQDGPSAPRYWAGGSCGNVLTILSYIGWESYPIARLGNDEASRYLIKDMETWGVNCSQIYQSNSVDTPLIVEVLSNSVGGIPSHSWKWFCPNCGSKLPTYRPILFREIERVGKEKLHSNVFYFDRVARSNVELAKISKHYGAVIVFEPSRSGNRRILEECLDIADIVKYSRGRHGHFQEALEKTNVPLEVETLGGQGLRYRIGNRSQHRQWEVVPAYQIGNSVKDTAGSGDWCSAGIIHVLCRFGRGHFENLKHEDIQYAMNFSQALAALNCCYTGARGLMYDVAKGRLEILIQNVWENKALSCIREKDKGSADLDSLHSICPNCTNNTVST